MNSDSAYGLSVKLDLENDCIVYMCRHLPYLW